MLVMTAKVDKKKIAIVIAAVIVLAAALILLLGGRDHETPAATAATSVSSNDDRVKFLTSLGWEVVSSPVESGQVRIPQQSSEVFTRYNALQKSQGYDLSTFQGQTVMRYVYKIKNYPGAAEPVYATLLISKNQVIGGDVTDTAANGVVRGFKMPATVPQPSGSAPTGEPSAPSADPSTPDANASGTVPSTTPSEPTGSRSK